MPTAVERVAPALMINEGNEITDESSSAAAVQEQAKKVFARVEISRSR